MNVAHKMIVVLAPRAPALASIVNPLGYQQRAVTYTGDVPDAGVDVDERVTVLEIRAI